MGALILSHPFRLAGDGTAATVEQGTTPAQAEQLAVHLLTRRGERELVPAFGTTDPVFGTVDAAELAASVELFGPQVSVDGVETEYPSDTEAVVRVTFTD